MMKTSTTFVTDLRVNIVYYGAGVAGKATNLRYIHANLAPDVRGELVSQCFEEYRYLFFDFVMPDIGRFEGNVPIFRVQCLPGCVRDRRIREQQLFVGVNAIVFVVDSHTERLDANLEMLEMLEQHLWQQGHTLEDIPWVIQYNKRDVSKHQILPVHELQRYLNRYDVPYFEAIATQGIGVFETLKAVLQLAVTKTGKG